MTMKKIIFLEHSLERMEKREITQELIIATLNSPNSIILNNENRKIAQRFIDGKLIRVIYEEEMEKIIVVTAYKTSKIGKYI